MKPISYERKIGNCRVILLIIATIFFVCLFPIKVYAHDSQDEHDDDLQDVLFGEGYNLAGQRREKFQAIADAAALCIDQYSINGTIKSKKTLFDSLDKRIGFSFRFEDIELQKMPDNKTNVSPSTHRSFTHKGWNYTEYPLPKLWGKRKKILTATVNKELFNESPGILSHVPFAEGLLYSEGACNKEAEAFCSLVYYVHILGDYDEATSYSNEFMQLIPLVRHEDKSAPALIDELISCSEVLFKNQGNLYSDLKSELEKEKNLAEDAVTANGGLENSVHFDAYLTCARNILELLKQKVPQMLRNTDYFHKAFYD